MAPGQKKPPKQKLKITKESAKQKPKPQPQYFLNDTAVYTGLAFHSNKFWRGRDFYGDSASLIRPWISYSPFAHADLHAEWELLTGDVNGVDPDATFNALNFTFNYNINYEFSTGIRMNWFYNSDRTDNNGVIIEDLSFMTAYLKYNVYDNLDFELNADYYLSDAGGARSQLGDFYMKLDYYYGLAYIRSILLNIGLNASLAYYINNRLDETILTPSTDEGVSGFSDLTLGVALSRYRIIDRVSGYLNLNMAWLPSDKWSSLNAYDQSRLRFWFVAGLSTRI